jgi:hypothetical protein
LQGGGFASELGGIKEVAMWLCASLMVTPCSSLCVVPNHVVLLLENLVLVLSNEGWGRGGPQHV